MTAALQQVDPAEAGLDAGRLARLDKHFAAFVDDGRFAGWQLAITRGDRVVHRASYGHRDREAGLPVTDDTVWRIASMTKPITSVTAMTLWEEGAFELNDPVSRWIPSFADVRVYRAGTAADVFTEPALEPVKVWHLLTHTSGLSAGFLNTHVVDALYRKAGYEWGAPPKASLAECVEDWARIPLRSQPGTRWGYGCSTDVLGRLIEIWDGRPLDEAVAARVTGPLGMTDTVWWADPARAERLAMLYGPHPETRRSVPMPAFAAASLKEPTVLSGGGGLLSTVDDYTVFTRMLANGGALDGTRVLAPRTLEIMTTNHLPGGADLQTLSTGGFAETSLDGVGFGLGFATIDDPVRLKGANSRGEYYWGGAASTAFWVDPSKDVTVVFMSQLLPSSAHPVRSQLRQMVYSALVG